MNLSTVNSSIGKNHQTVLSLVANLMLKTAQISLGDLTLLIILLTEYSLILSENGLFVIT